MNRLVNFFVLLGLLALLYGGAILLLKVQQAQIAKYNYMEERARAMPEIIESDGKRQIDNAVAFQLRTSAITGFILSMVPWIALGLFFIREIYNAIQKYRDSKIETTSA